MDTILNTQIAEEFQFITKIETLKKFIQPMVNLERLNWNADEEAQKAYGDYRSSELPDKAEARQILNEKLIKHEVATSNFLAIRKTLIQANRDIFLLENKLLEHRVNLLFPNKFVYETPRATYKAELRILNAMMHKDTTDTVQDIYTQAARFASMKCKTGEYKTTTVNTLKQVVNRLFKLGATTKDFEIL